MPTLVAKIIADDGTEKSYGPLVVDDFIADQVNDLLSLQEESRVQALEVAQVEQAARDTEARNHAAEAENIRRRELADQGIDPDEQVT